MHYIYTLACSHLQTITSSVNAKQKSRVISHSSLPTFDEVLHIHTYAHTLRIDNIYNNVSFCMCVFNYGVYMGVLCGVACTWVCCVVWRVHGCGAVCTWVWCVVWRVHGCGVWYGVYMGVLCTWVCCVVTVKVVFRVLQVLEFSVEGTHLCLTSLTISVWDHKKITKDVFLGTLDTLFLNFNGM